MKRIASALALAVLLSACGGEVGSDEPGVPTTGATITTPETTSAPATSSAGQGLERAATTALRAVPDATLISIETEGRNWEVQVVTPDGTEHEVIVNGAGTKVVRESAKQEEQADRDKHLERVRRAELDYREAADAMRASVPGARITELNLDTYRGTVVWEGDVIGADGSRHAVKIDAATGRALQR